MTLETSEGYAHSVLEVIEALEKRYRLTKLMTSSTFFMERYFEERGIRSLGQAVPALHEYLQEGRTNDDVEHLFRKKLIDESPVTCKRTPTSHHFLELENVFYVILGGEVRRYKTKAEALSDLMKWQVQELEKFMKSNL
jgi:hypothetical protein